MSEWTQEDVELHRNTLEMMQRKVEKQSSSYQAIGYDLDDVSDMLDEIERLQRMLDLMRKAVAIAREQSSLDLELIQGQGKALDEAREEAEGLAEFIDETHPDGESAVAELPWK